MVHGLLNDQEITCPICLETVASGEEVCSKYEENEEKEEYWRTNQPTNLHIQVVLPGCAASEMHAGHVECIEGWLARFAFVRPSSIIISNKRPCSLTMATMFIVQFIIIWTVHTQERDLPGLQGASRRFRF